MTTSDPAWQAWLAALDAVRRRMLGRPEAIAHPRVREQALYALQAVTIGAHQMYLLPRQDYAQFQTRWHPFLLNWGGPASVMRYQWCFIDGRRSYRIRGRRGTTCFTDLQVFSGYFGDERMRSLGNYDLARFHVDSDGRFEAVASPDPQPGNWIRLDPEQSRSIVQVRDVFDDWGARATELDIDTLDRPADSMHIDEAEFSVRLARTTRMVEQTVARALGYAKRVRQIAGGDNAFAEVKAEGGGESRDHGASPRAGYYGLVWNIAPGEALVIEAPAPTARYWGLQLMDLWWGTLDYAWHQSGLNGRQMQVDADGRFRAVLSFEDPGIANWLDPMHTPVGQCMLRWYDGTTPDLPQVRKVPFAERFSFLPAGTRTIDPAARAAAIAQRAAQALARGPR
ncbi:MAG: DUF1214 domain-containing protein [Gammaproteobacteria bacterium]